MQNLSFFDRLVLRIKRAESPPFRIAKRALATLAWPVLPPLPRWLLRVLRAFYEFHFLVIMVFRALITIFYRNPLFQSRCASFGRNVRMEGRMPFVSGHVQIHIGNNVGLGGGISVTSARLFDEPRLIIKDGTPDPLGGFVKFFELSDVGLTVSDRDQKEDPIQDGVLLKDVRKDSPFASGLRAGDVVTALDRTKATSPEVFRRLLRRKLGQGGPILTFSVRRGERTVDMSIPIKD